VLSMNELTRNDLLVPFYYVPSASPGCCDNNFFQNDHFGLYYSSNCDSRDENSSSSTAVNNEHSASSTRDFYYHNCLVDLWMKMYTKTASERATFTKHLMIKMPLNVSVMRLFVHNATKSLGVKVTLQTMYDHLTLNLVNNESIWILCIKLCLNLNDLQQAILMYQQAESICARDGRSVVALKQLATVLLNNNTSSTIIKL